MDQRAYELLGQLRFPEIIPIALEDFERDDDALQSAKQNRSTIEYYFTCTPSLPLYILQHWPEVDLITYVDSDLFLFSDPQPLYDKMANASIAIIGHRFPPENKRSEIYGLYNVGWLMFRRDDNGLACLQWWRERCIEWCYDRLEGERFADQKYLDQWQTLFQGVIVLEHKGANLAPWNVAGYQLSYQSKTQTVLVDEQPLIFFHFHGLKRKASWLYEPRWEEYRITPTSVLKRKIYAPYVTVLEEIYQQLAEIAPGYGVTGDLRHHRQTTAAKTGSPGLAEVRQTVGAGLRILLGGHYLIILGGRVL